MNWYIRLSARILLLLLPLAAFAEQAPTAPMVTKDLALPAEIVSALQEARSLRTNNPAAAEDCLRKAISSRRAPALLYELAIYKYRDRAYEQAWTLFEEVASLEEHFPGVHKNLGLLAYQRGKWEKARVALLAGIAQEGLDAGSAAALGMVYLQQQQPTQAETALRWALLFQPEDLELLLALGQSLYLQTRYHEAEMQALAAARRQPTHEAAWRLAVNACLEQKAYSAAIDHLEALLRLVPSCELQLHWLLGRLYLQAGMPTVAVKYFSHLLQSPNQATLTLEHLSQLLQAFHQAGQMDAAEAFAERILKQKPEDPQALLIKAHQARAHDQRAQARSYYERVLRADPLSGEALLALGQLLIDEPEPEQIALGVAHLRSARALPKYEEAALRAEGNYYLKTRDFREAQQILRILKEKYPDPTWDALLQEVQKRVQ